MDIVNLSEKYIKSLVKLENKCFSTPWTEAMFYGDIKNCNTRYFAALEGEDVVGYAGMWLSADGGQITNIAVAPSHRRKGIASALLKRLCTVCEEEKAEAIMLEVRSGNNAAVSLYEKFGFKKVGERKNYYKNPTEDALLMTKYFI